ncbi:MAG TPA: ABC transporter ATP-binding protein [Coriobacteriia bacterium]|nr:ABC transporter ATP-binding protein [Coriobacteriia bacterium]
MSSALIRSLRFVKAYLGWAALGVLAVLASTAADLLTPQLLRRLIDVGITQGQQPVILRDSLLLIAVAAAGGLASFAQGYFSARASHGAAYDMRNQIFDKLQRLSFAYHDRAQAGQLITRVTSDVDLVRDFVGGGLVQVVSAALLLAGAVVFLVRLDPTLAMLAFIVLPATVGVLFIFVRRLGPMFKESQQRLAALNTVLQENVAGVRVVRAFTREGFETARYERANRSLFEQGMKVRRTVANAFPLLFSVGTIGVGFVTWAGAVQILRGTLTVGELVAFTSYLFLLLQPLFVIGFGATQIARAGASAERLFEILDAPQDVAEKPSAIALPRLEGSVSFIGVHLRYPGAEQETLAGIDLAIAPDTTVAVVGATGSGKTSLVNLVPRFYDATEGKVLVDGLDVRDVTLPSLRGQIGFVMQDSLLFSGSVRENIAYGRPDAVDEEIQAAAQAAQAHDFILALPQSYDTRVGERGVKLSGGQRQRIAIARALLVDPRILVMDDSTSSVDSATEAAIRDQLDRLMLGRTTLIVAQRLSTARRADLVVVMEAGRIADAGSHNELLQRSCLYAEIAASQLIGDGDIDVPDHCTLGLDVSSSISRPEAETQAGDLTEDSEGQPGGDA